MDVQMPEIGGFEATALIRQWEKVAGGHLPIIAMTAHAMKGDRERCLAAGMDAHVSKPVRANELLETIERTVKPIGPPELPKAKGPGGDGLVDWPMALKAVGGDREILRELVSVFLEVCPEWLERLREAVGRPDAAEIRRLAHSVKGA